YPFIGGIIFGVVRRLAVLLLNTLLYFLERKNKVVGERCPTHISSNSPCKLTRLKIGSASSHSLLWRYDRDDRLFDRHHVVEIRRQAPLRDAADERIPRPISTLDSI